ncbi:hypothetical protein HYH02_006492 [Chlamydomonas schloesseri]|uniref:Uncharacterized protein n=1 Tax=Chlamydomonas schloesseri TaxID=2026947 RepID=A0A835WJJ8_9CHLO|nr:hypothetical protein HYH02_006492 [Chlamydomonas schloesseri]|eukprot:KAG2448601.1 hypothetical protein HYH02_006492 [Chlamydomonas schloesseri]
MPLLNKNNKKEISAIQDLIEAKVYVNPERREELLALREQLWGLPLEELPGGATCTLLCLNLSDKVEEALRSSLPGWTLQIERICDNPDAPEYKDDRKRFVKLFSGKALEGAGVAAIVHELRSQDDELAQLDKRVIALSLLGKLPVVSCSCSGANALPAAAAATGDTWPVFFTPHPHEDIRPMAEWLREELPRVRALSAAVTEEVQARTAHLGKVNAPLHFLKRGAVALVPFGVLTVNTLGIVRLMANMLQLSGMRGDTSANKALGLLGAENAALVSAVDSLGDVYSFAVFATVLADLQGMGFVEAAEAMDVVDGLTLGSIGVVTGAVSALGAYLSRAVMVRSAGQFLASLQTIYALNPAMRRETLERKTKKKKKRHGGRHKAAAGGTDGGAGAAGDKEELRGLLQRSTAGGKTREQKQEGKKKGRKGAQAHSGLEERHGAAAAALAAADSDVEADDDGDDHNNVEEEEEPTAQSGSESQEEGDLASSSGAGGEEQGASASAASAAAVAAVSAAAAAEDLAAAAEQAAAEAEAEAAEAEAEADAESLAATSTTGLGTGKLTREEKKQLALARRAAAADAKAKAAEAKAAAKAAAAAAKAAEKERLAAEKAAAKEAAREAKARKAEEKAIAREEAKAAKAAAAAARVAEKERQAAEKAAAKEAARAAREEARAAKAGANASEPSTSSIVGPEGWQEAPAAPAAAAPKLKWWQRGRKEGPAAAAAAAAAAAPGAAGVAAGDGVDSGGGGASSSDESAWGIPVLGGAVGASAGERDVEEAVARDERMGLDAETRAALAQFLSLEEEDVYGAEDGGGTGEGLAAAAVAVEGGALRPLGSRI